MFLMFFVTIVLGFSRRRKKPLGLFVTFVLVFLDVEKTIGFSVTIVLALSTSQKTKRQLSRQTRRTLSGERGEERNGPGSSEIREERGGRGERREKRERERERQRREERRGREGRGQSHIRNVFKRAALPLIAKRPSPAALPLTCPTPPPVCGC